MNNIFLNRYAGEKVKYKSDDSLMDQIKVMNFPMEFLDSLDVSELPPYI